jgi:hypothetical protein
MGNEALRQIFAGIFVSGALGSCENRLKNIDDCMREHGFSQKEELPNIAKVNISITFRLPQHTA